MDPGTSRVSAAAAVCAAVFLIYSRSLSAFFFEDDFQLLVGAWHFDPATLLQHRPRYKPVFEIYFWLGSIVFGRSPMAFHGASIALHIVNGWLVLAIARRLGMRPVFAFLTAMLFVVQPAFVAAVAWVGAIAESLVVLFGCTTALAVLRFRDTGRRVWLAIAVAAFALALLSHESGVVFLPIVILIDHIATRRPAPWRDLVQVHWPLAAVAAAYLALTFTANTPSYLGSEIGYRPGLHIVSNVFDYIAALYVGERTIASHLLVATVLALVLWKGSSRARLGVAWMILGILPFAPFDTGILSRYAYVPAIGLAILLAEGLASLHSAIARRSSALASGVVMALGLGLCLRFGYFARDGVKDQHAMAERYRVFFAELRQERPQIPSGTLVVISRERAKHLNAPFVEAAVQWEYRDPTLRVEVRDGER